MGWADVGWSMIVTSGFSWWVRKQSFLLDVRAEEGNSHISGPIQNALQKGACKERPKHRKCQCVDEIWRMAIYIYISIYNNIKYLMFHLESLERNYAVNKKSNRIQPNPTDFSKTSPSLCPVTVYDQNISRYGWKIKMMLLKNLVLTTVNLLVWIESRLKAN